MRGGKRQKTTPHSNVMNLSSSYRLTSLEEEVLERGLTFIPAPGPAGRMEIRRDLHNYHRKLKILDHFNYNSQFSHKPFTNPSAWEPNNTEMCTAIQTLIKQDLEFFKTFRPRPPGKCNLSKQQLEAIKKLSKNQDIIIKPADKGSQIVIMDKFQYLFEANKQLSNRKHYVPLQQSIQSETKILIRDILERLHQKRFISTKQLQYLSGPDSPRNRIFYLLPKIHKPPEKWTVPGEVPCGRPIVSDCGSESCRVAEYIDHFINPLSQKHNSYIKDTYDFINKIKNLKLSNNAFLFTIDINSLYTNIDTTLGLRAVREAFKKFPNKERPDNELLKLLELSLTRNDFKFNDKHFLQIHGTAMGKKFAPAYANLYMCLWEETAFTKCTHLPLIYYRYLDDIFGIWNHSTSEFLEFVTVLNTHHSSITITHNIQLESIEFLDTQAFFIPQDDGTKTLGTRVFFKHTDRHALLHKSSYHPKHTFAGIIKSQLIRFHRICTLPEDVERATSTLFAVLRTRGYSRRFLRSIKAEVKESFQSNNNYKSERDQKNLIPLILTYSDDLVRLGSSVRAHFQQAQQENEALGDFRVILAYRRNKNLKDLLVHSDLARAGTKRQNLRTFFSIIKFIKNIETGSEAPVWQKITMETRNVVYGIKCKKCHKLYIGETKNPLVERLKQHIYHIRKMDRSTALYSHFQHHTLESVQIFGLEHNLDWTRKQRQRAEWMWINKLNTYHPLGLNEKFE